MKADPQVQRRLLDLQAIDTALAQLAHRRRIAARAGRAGGAGPGAVRAGGRAGPRPGGRRRPGPGHRPAGEGRRPGPGPQEQGRGPAGRRHRPGPRAGGAPARAGLAEPPAGRPGGRRAGADGAAGDRAGRARRRSSGGSPRPGTGGPRPSSAATTALAEIAKEEEFKRGARQPLAADLPADLVSLYDKIREDTGLGAALLTARPLRRLPAGAVRRRPGPDPQGRTRTTWSAARSAGGSWSVPTSRACSVVAVRAVVDRGRRRVPGQPRARPATARWSATRRPARCWPSAPSRSARPPTTSPSTGA